MSKFECIEQEVININQTAGKFMYIVYKGNRLTPVTNKFNYISELCIFLLPNVNNLSVSLRLMISESVKE